MLMTGYALGSEARTRMETMVRTNDGFEIAEVDMKLRGPGDIQGTQQSGKPIFPNIQPQQGWSDSSSSPKCGY